MPPPNERNGLTIPDFTSLDYRVKDRILRGLVENAKRFEGFEQQLFSLGKALTENPAISMRQADALLIGLKRAGVLKYVSGIDKQEKEIDDEEFDSEPHSEASKLNFEERRKALNASVDSVAHRIEFEGKLQATAVIVAYELFQGKSVTDKIQAVAALLNSAHLEVRADNFFDPRPFDDPKWERGIEVREKLDKTVFTNRETYLDELQAVGIVSKEEREVAPEADFDELSESEVFNFMVAVHFINSIKGDSMIHLIQQLQPVLHAGFAAGVRDVNASNAIQFGGDEE